MYVLVLFLAAIQQAAYKIKAITIFKTVALLQFLHTT